MTLECYIENSSRKNNPKILSLPVCVPLSTHEKSLFFLGRVGKRKVTKGFGEKEQKTLKKMVPTVCATAMMMMEVMKTSDDHQNNHDCILSYPIDS